MADARALLAALMDMVEENGPDYAEADQMVDARAFLAQPAVPVGAGGPLPWDHTYESGPDSMACITCGFVGSYAHTEQFYRKWVFPSLAAASEPAEGEGL